MIEILGLPAASTFADDIDRVFTIIFVAVGFWFLLAEGVFFWLIFRFKKKDGVKAQYITGELKSEKRWITVPHNIILLFDIVIVVAAVQVWYDVKQDLPEEPDKQVVRVIAQQWAWTFVHPGPDGKLDTPDDIAKVNEMHVQADRLHHFQLESKDVIHSFSVPVFRLKQDVIPGRVITGWFTPTKTGTYDIQCTEICGVGHALMPAKIVIQTAAEHAEWVAKNSSVAVASAALR
ncbi:MAG: cytochrome C oxidase subunit II [Proteobacteria bacterium]|nr:MAG: cytochrome C oxidase subunit II [Pseudomonadota bacterium]